MRKFSGRAGAVSLVMLLSACGGGGSSGGSVSLPTSPSSPSTPATGRGSLIGSATLVPVVQADGTSASTLSPAALTQLLENVETGFTKVIGAPVCSITSYTVKYRTIGGQGEATDASAAVMAPSGSDPSCTGPRPVVLYAHGTTADKTYDMAKIGQNSEARLIAAVFASQGFIVVAPNYTGYNSSSLAYHPYLSAEGQGSDMIDAMRAARASFSGIGVSAAARLFITGYSQGGYVALATQKTMQAEFPTEFSITGTSGMSGPYALLQTADNVFNGNPTQGVTLFLPLLINSAQHSSTPVYTNASDVYAAPYATGIETLLPGTLSTGDLVAQNKLPATALFAPDSQPQGAGAAAFFASGNLIQSSYRSAYLADYAAQPCDVNAASPLACSPTNGLRKFVLNNDLRNYLPGGPLLLCGGQNDPTVPFYNTSAASGYFTARGKTGMTVLDLESQQGASDPYALERLGFAAAKAALRVNAIANKQNPDAAVASSYHAGLVAPFCLLSTRAFFQGIPL